MQSIDLLTHSRYEQREFVTAMELKSTKASLDNLRQIQRYVNWLRLYYQPLMPAHIRPVLITERQRRPRRANLEELLDAIAEFNSNNLDCESLVWLTFTIETETLDFREESLSLNGIISS